MRATTRLATVLLLAVGCAKLDDVAPGTVVTCSTTGECPGGRICNRGRCVLPSELGVPPDLVLVEGKVAVSPPAGRAGTTFTVTLEATKELEAPPRVILSLDPLVELRCAATAARTYACPYTATGSERGGLGGQVTIDVRLVDLAGQEAIKNGVGSFDLDFAPPVLAARSVEPASVPLGGALQVFFTTDEELGASPVLVASRPLDAPGDGLRFSPARQPGTRNYAFTHVVTRADGAGAVGFTVDLTDAVGNTATGLPVGSVVVDPVPPAISSLAAAPPRLAASGTLTVTFDASEPAAPAGLAVTVGGRAVSCDASSAATPSYTCTRAMAGDELAAGTEAVQPVVVALADAAGNRTTASTSVVFDFRAPGLSSGTAGPASVPLGGTLVVSLTPDEDLAGNPVLVASRPLDVPGGGTRFPLTAQPGTRSYVFAHLVTTSDTSGPVTFTVELTDAVGNASPGVPVGSVTIDTLPPEISSVAVSPARIGRSGTVTATFDVDEAAAPGTLAVTVGGRAMGCGAYSAGSPSYSCTRDMTGAELGAGTEAAQAVVISLADGAGNPARASGSTLFDFRPPGVAAASVVYAPGPGNPLTQVSRATVGTKVTLTALADEALDAQRPMSVVAGLGGATLPLTRNAAASTSTSAVFEAIVPAGLPDGDYAATLTWTDLAGNTAVTGASLPPIRVRAAAPRLVVNHDALVFVRSPLGSAADEPAGVGYTIPAGPYFAVEPGDALTTSVTLPAGSLLIELTSPAGVTTVVPSAVIVQSSSSSTTALTLGVLAPTGGLFPRQKLVSPDLAGVWLVGVDDAGNRSAAVQLRDSEWVATPNRPAFGPPQHLVAAAAYAVPSRSQDLAVQAIAPGDAAAIDTVPVLARAAGVWQEVGWNGARPGIRGRHGAAYDTARDRLVVFGGMDGIRLIYGDTWEWDGTMWSSVASTGPSAREYAVLAYDSARGRTVLFGGRDAQSLLPVNDTWEWDGASWSLVATTGPEGRTGHAMAYDPVRRRIVLFGGSDAVGLRQDTWEWDGSTWWPAASAGPAPRHGHAMAYDGARNQVILFGGWDTGPDGFQDTQAWTGTQWVEVATTGATAREGHAMAYDGARARVVLYGGVDVNSNRRDTWEWDGVRWSQRANGPRANLEPAMAYDSARRRVVLFGGWNGGSTAFGDTVEWDGTSWTSVATPAPSVYEARMTYDVARGRLVLFGGSAATDTWEWNGRGWTRVATVGPPARRWPAMAYDTARSRTVMFGGEVYGSNVLLQDTQAWDGATWTTVATGGPGPRSGAGFAVDESSGIAVLFGGQDATGFLGDTWELSGASWSLRATTGPAPRALNALAYDPVNRCVVQVNGATTWGWTGSGWRVLSTASPPARTNSALATDTARRRVILHGGYAGVELGDTWEWDGTRWTQVGSSVPRSSHAMAYDRLRDRTMLFDGGVIDETWAWSAPTDHRPAVQFAASIVPFGVALDRIQRVQVRAVAWGGSAVGGDGATLSGWANRAAGNAPGAWDPLVSNTAASGAIPAYLPGGAGARLDWRSSSVAEARRFLVDRDGFTFQVGPRGGTGPAPDAAWVALDYVEVRVRYAAP